MESTAQVEEHHWRLLRPHAGQKRLAALIHTPDLKVLIAVLGRRWGKTTAGVQAAIQLALERQGIRIGWFAHQFSGARVAWRSLMRKVPHTAVRSKSESRLEIEWINGSSLHMYGAENPASALGEGFGALFIDEGARVRGETRDNTISPMVADSNGPIIVFTTPKGKSGVGGWVYRDFQRAKQEEPGYRFMHGPTTENPNPNIQDWAVWAKDNLPEQVYRQEILAEFLDYGAGVLDFSPVCTMGGDRMDPVPLPWDWMNREDEEEPEPIEEACVQGVDLAQRTDWMVATVMGVESGKVYAMDRFRHLPWEAQVARAAAQAEQYEAVSVVDATGVGNAVVEMMENAGMDVHPVVFTSEKKQTIIQGLQVAVEKREIELPWFEEVISEGETFEAEVLTSGRLRYRAAEGFHDDTVVSLGLCVWGRTHAATELGERM